MSNTPRRMYMGPNSEDTTMEQKFKLTQDENVNLRQEVKNASLENQSLLITNKRLMQAQKESLEKLERLEAELSNDKMNRELSHQLHTQKQRELESELERSKKNESNLQKTTEQLQNEMSVLKQDSNDKQYRQQQEITKLQVQLVEVAQQNSIASRQCEALLNQITEEQTCKRRLVEALRKLQEHNP